MTCMACAGWLVAQLGWMKLGPRPSLRVFATRLLPVVAFTAGSLYFGNVAYLSLSVAFIQILKVRSCRLMSIAQTHCRSPGLIQLDAVHGAERPEGSSAALGCVTAAVSKIT